MSDIKDRAAENDERVATGKSVSDECCRKDFDAQAAVLSLSRDVARLSEAIAKMEAKASPGPASALRSAVGLASASDQRVERILASVAPERREQFAEVARQLVRSGDLARKVPTNRPDMFTRIVGGEEVQPGNYLHCVCVGEPDQWMCTGALVAGRVVLTAAHCGEDIARIMVGSEDVFARTPPPRIVPVVSAVQHPAYRASPYSENDITVLILGEDAGEEPVEIATSGQIAAAQKIRLVGFGYNDPQRPRGFGVKRQVTIDFPPIIRTGVNDGLADLERFLDFHGDYEFVSGRKGLGRDTCNGDSGGPAYITADSKTRLAGLTSRATREATVNCGDGGIYVRPERFREWIDGVVAEAGVEPIGWN